MSDKDEVYVANTTDASVVIDGAGRMLDGGSSGSFPESKQIRDGLKNGTLIKVEKSDKGDEDESDSNKSDSGTVASKSKSKTRTER